MSMPNIDLEAMSVEGGEVAVSLTGSSGETFSAAFLTAWVKDLDTEIPVGRWRVIRSPPGIAFTMCGKRAVLHRNRSGRSDLVMFWNPPTDTQLDNIIFQADVLLTRERRWVKLVFDGSEADDQISEVPVEYSPWS